ncbi:MAG TPA: hypothetical protein VI685_18035 [Candidatus Angelobacter sp.]
MAVTKVKRSVVKTANRPTARRGLRQLAVSNRTKPTAKPQDKKRSILLTAHRRVVQFPQAKGKIVEGVEFSTCSEYHSISINFQDKTCLNFSIETGFILKGDHSDWKTGNQHVFRRWLLRSS